MIDGWRKRGNNAGVVFEQLPARHKYNPEFTKDFIIVAVLSDFFLNVESIESHHFVITVPSNAT